MIKPMDSESTQGQEESQVTKGNGEMISNMGRDGRYGKMEVSILELTLIPRKKEWGCTYGLMETDTWEGGETTRSMETWVYTNGRMGEPTMEAGRAI
jgi:hypothetical protein